MGEIVWKALNDVFGGFCCVFVNGAKKFEVASEPWMDRVRQPGFQQGLSKRLVGCQPASLPYAFVGSWCHFHDIFPNGKPRLFGFWQSLQIEFFISVELCFHRDADIFSPIFLPQRRVEYEAENLLLMSFNNCLGFFFLKSSCTSLIWLPFGYKYISRL